MTIEKRLKSERTRLGYNQSDFAALAGRTKKTLIDYEKGSTSPDSKFLAAIAAAKADVHYILTGETKQERLLKAIEEATKKVKDLPLVDDCKAAIAQLLVGLQDDNLELITDALDIIRSDYVGLGKPNSNLTPTEKALLAAYRKAAPDDQAVIGRIAELTVLAQPPAELGD